MAADALGRPVEGSISVNRDLTNLALLRLVTAALVFWLSLQLCRDAKRARSFLRGIGVIGAGYAIYGSIAVSAPVTRLAWLDNISADGLISSTFINRNSFAAYAGLGLVTIVGLTIQLYCEEIRRWAVNRRSVIAAGIEVAGRRGAVLFGAGFLLSVALLLSGSRGAVSATGLALLVLIIASSWSRQRAALGAVLILGSAAAAALLLVFGDPLIAGLRERGLGDINRLSVYLITMRSVLDAPLLGQGYGSFIDIFPMYRDQSISVYGIWSQAHDTYLEVLQGLGLVFGSMLIVSVLLLVFCCLKGAALRRDNVVPSIAIAAAALVGVHAVVDFGLQIQAIALTFVAILGAGVAQSKSARLDLDD